MRYIITLAMTIAALPVSAEVPKVVTDLPAVHSLTAQVMGDLGTPDLLLSAGADAHSFQLRPSQAAALSEAGLVVWLGPEMTPWLDRALASVAPSVPVGLLAQPGTYLRPMTEAGSGDGHDHDHGHDHGPQGGTDGAAKGAIDPHAWLDPANAQAWLDVIAAALASRDPDNAATYHANAQTARDRIAAMDADIAGRLAGLRDVPVVFFHDAYGYFTDHYGLSVAGTVALGDAAAPGAARLADIRDRLEDAGAACIFPEVQHDPALVASVAEGTGAWIGPALDPSGSSLPPGPGLYEALMRTLADSLAACATR